MHFRQWESRRGSQTTGPLAFLVTETNLKFLHLPSSGIIQLPPTHDQSLPWAEESYPKDVACGGHGVRCHRQRLLLQARSKDSPSLALSKDEVKGEGLFLEHLQHLRTRESCKEQAALAIAPQLGASPP